MKRHYCSICGAKRNEDKMELVRARIGTKPQWICRHHMSANADIMQTYQSNKDRLFLELFAGSKRISAQAARRGYQTITVDIEPKYQPDICIDIMNLRRSILPAKVDVVWASIPCQVYSVINLENHWDKIEIGYRSYYYIPKTDDAQTALNMLNKTLRLIARLNPLYYFLENPRGALRHFPHLNLVPFRHTVSYADYGSKVYKPTDIWTNNPRFSPRRIKTSVGRKFEKGIMDLKSAYERSLVPEQLIEEVLDSIHFLEKSFI